MECLPGWDLLDNVCLLACVCLAVAARFCVLIIVTSAECREEYEAATSVEYSKSAHKLSLAPKFMQIFISRQKEAKKRTRCERLTWDCSVFAPSLGAFH
jgi:hypothetical protein